MFRFIILVTFACVFAAHSIAAEKMGTLDLDKQRDEALKAFDSSQISNPAKVEKLANTIFSKKLGAQTEKKLKLVANQANRLANLIGSIGSEYSSYYNKNYQYKFIKDEVVGPHDAYVKAGNKFKSIRNRAYLNLGIKMKSKGETLRAFLYFKDVFRLSAFDCGKNKPKEQCMRWIAEQEMQKLLSLTHISSYVSWQKNR